MLEILIDFFTINQLEFSILFSQTPFEKNVMVFHSL